ncbi:MAG: hypothetical protein WC624_02185 [Candidatus Margulisiibacteriota bacterium]
MTISAAGKSGLISILYLREYLDYDAYLKNDYKDESKPSPLSDAGVKQVKKEKWDKALDEYLASVPDADKQKFIELFGLKDEDGTTALTPAKLRARHISNQILTDKAGNKDLVGALSKVKGSSIVDSGKTTLISIMFIREYLDFDAYLKGEASKTTPLDGEKVAQVKREKWDKALEDYLAQVSEVDKQEFITLFELKDEDGTTALTPAKLRARHISKQILNQKEGSDDLIVAICKIDSGYGGAGFCPVITPPPPPPVDCAATPNDPSCPPKPNDPYYALSDPTRNMLSEARDAGANWRTNDPSNWRDDGRMLRYQYPAIPWFTTRVFGGVSFNGSGDLDTRKIGGGVVADAGGVTNWGFGVYPTWDRFNTSNHGYRLKITPYISHTRTSTGSTGEKQIGDAHAYKTQYGVNASLTNQDNDWLPNVNVRAGGLNYRAGHPNIPQPNEDSLHLRGNAVFFPNNSYSLEIGGHHNAGSLFWGASDSLGYSRTSGTLGARKRIGDWGTAGLGYRYVATRDQIRFDFNSPENAYQSTGGHGIYGNIIGDFGGAGSLGLAGHLNIMPNYHNQAGVSGVYRIPTGNGAGVFGDSFIYAGFDYQRDSAHLFPGYTDTLRLRGGVDGIGIGFNSKNILPTDFGVGIDYGMQTINYDRNIPSESGKVGMINFSLTLDRPPRNVSNVGMGSRVAIEDHGNASAWSTTDSATHSEMPVDLMLGSGAYIIRNDRAKRLAIQFKAGLLNANYTYNEDPATYDGDLSAGHLPVDLTAAAKQVDGEGKDSTIAPYGYAVQDGTTIAEGNVVPIGFLVGGGVTTTMVAGSNDESLYIANVRRFGNLDRYILSIIDSRHTMVEAKQKVGASNTGTKLALDLYTAFAYRHVYTIIRDDKDRSKIKEINFKPEGDINEFVAVGNNWEVLQWMGVKGTKEEFILQLKNERDAMVIGPAMIAWAKLRLYQVLAEKKGSVAVDSEEIKLINSVQLNHKLVDIIMGYIGKDETLETLTANKLIEYLGGTSVVTPPAATPPAPVTPPTPAPAPVTMGGIKGRIVEKKTAA